MELMSGNEAIAQGAWEAGCTIGVAYPGTPSTETLEAFAKKEGVYAEWCVNEKVAVEVGIGASAAGARVLATMKHVGVNVAADPLFTAAYTGVGGGMVILAADDPGMYSSQNEQDSHYYAQAAAIPCLDPADSAEALRFTREAYDISERFDVPVIIRSSVRISHTKTPVEAGERAEAPARPYEKNPAKWVMMPAFAKPRRLVQLDRIDKLRQWVETCPYNEVIEGKGTVGVVCAGAAYQHVAEALPDASIFKLGVTWPLPAAALRDFADSVEAVYVVEEGSEYLKDAVRACGVPVSDTPCPLPRAGELSPGLVRAAFGLEQPSHAPAATDLPGRPPALCPGMPPSPRVQGALEDAGHRDRRHRLLYLGRPAAALGHGHHGGHGSLGLHGPRLRAGAGRHGASSHRRRHRGLHIRPFGVELAHLHGVQPRRRHGVRARQPHHRHDGAPGQPLQRRDPAEPAQPRVEHRGRGGCPRRRGCARGRSQRRRRRATALKEATGSDDISVIVFRSPCVLLERHVEPPLFVSGSCTACGACVTLGCPALGRDETGRALIDPALCIGCGHCTQYCRFDAIVQE